MWFKLLWESSTTITDEILNSVVELWKKRRNQRPIRRKVESLFDAAKQNLNDFEDREIYFIVNRNELSEEASAALEHTKNTHTNLFERIDCYDDLSELPNNAYLIDIYYGPRGGVKVYGIYWTPEEPIIEKFKYKNGSTGKIKYCFKKNSIEGYKITKECKEVIKKHVSELWEYQLEGNKVNIIPFIDGIKILRKSI